MNGLRTRILILFILVIMSPIIFSCNKDSDELDSASSVIENRFIYGSDSEYCAFCDLIYYNDKYYIAFRVGSNHAPYNDSDTNGYIKILSSSDTYSWTEEIDVIDDEWDMRDPCFCINNHNELTLNYGVHRFNEKPSPKNYRVLFAYENDKLIIKDRNPVNIGDKSNYWIWKIYFHDNKYWGVGYYEKENPILLNSDDGINYKICSVIPGFEGEETALVFDNDKIYAFTRNVKRYENAYLSWSQKPYNKWEVSQLNRELSGPEACIANGEIYVAARGPFGVSVYTFDYDRRNLSFFLNLFAQGDYGHRGYPGILYIDNYLNIVYYACNDFELYPSIYLTRVKLR